VIPCLLVHEKSLVKTVQFNKFQYVGDPLNTCRIFNELEVDELAILDILAGKERREPNYKLLKEIASECFMPLSYGGGIKTLQQAKRIFDIGFEKVIVNTAACEDPRLITEIADVYGNQSVIASIDIKHSILKKYEVYTNGGRLNTKKNPVEWARTVEEYGAGEILLTNINREGTWEGFDLEVISRIADEVKIPLIANGGAGKISDIIDAVEVGHAAAVALGSMVVFQKKGYGVLVNFPSSKELDEWVRFY
jgi:cyclase